MTNGYRKQKLGGALAFLVAAGILSQPTEANANPGYSAWFRHHEELAGAWTFAAVPGDDLQVHIKSTVDNEGPAKKVLILYPRPSSGYDIAISKILDVFASKNLEIDMHAINFEKDDGNGAATLELAEREGFDLIYSMGSESTAWLNQYYRNGDIPVVSVCSKDPVALGHIDNYETGSGSNFAFTSLNMPIDVQLAYLLDFKTELKNLGILVGSRNISAIRTQAKPMEAAAKAKGINVQYIAIQDGDQTVDDIKRLLPEAIVEMRKTDPSLDNSLFWITGSTSVFSEINAINQYADRVPVVSAVPEVVRAGDESAVLAVGISFESNAYLAAVYGYDVLNGNVDPGELPVGIVSPPDIAINFRRARQIGLEVPFRFFESANYVYDYDGNPVRRAGKGLGPDKPQG
ncbi:MAG: ABC transporter substrate-binding protein [Geminicoccaceae bacterium]